MVDSEDRIFDSEQAGPSEERRPVSSDAAVPALPPLPPVHAAALPEVPPLAATGHSEEQNSSFLRWVIEFVVLVAAAFLLAMGVKTWVVQPFYIPSGSMEATLQIGDRVLVNKFIYRFTSPKRGDVVVFMSPESDSTDLIKRVIATGGQTVMIRAGVVSVDGKPLVEPYVSPGNRDDYTLPSPVHIPRGSVWVMGDNRGNSSDSRVFGPRPVSAILGRAFCIYWPVQRMRGL